MNPKIISIKVTKITILIRRNGPDLISFDVDLPSRFPKLRDDTPYLKMETAPGLAIKYIKDNFNCIPDEIIHESKGPITMFEYLELYKNE